MRHEPDLATAGDRPPTTSQAQVRPRNVICMKWGTLYPAAYVNRLYAMVRRNLQGPFRFVCLTDDAAGIDPAVECFPIPFVCDVQAGPDRAWRKLATFDWPLYDLEGTALFFDLDVVVVRPIDGLFALPGPFHIAHDQRLARRGISNSSVYRFELGAHHDLLQAFRADPTRFWSLYRNEQSFLSAWMHDKGFLAEWPAKWCVSFKYDCLPPWPLNYVKGAALPADARVVFFHGNPKPHEAAAGFRGVRRYTRPTPWIAANWR